MSSLGEKIKHEFHELIPVTVFFFVAFQLLALTERMILRQYGISTPVFVGATLMAFVVAKVVVISDHFPLVNRFPEKPLIYNVAWKTLIYLAAALAAHYLEYLIRFFRQTHEFGEANRQLFAHIIWPHFWCVQIWCFILLLIYCAFRELVRVLGRERIVRLFFHEAALPTTIPPASS